MNKKYELTDETKVVRGKTLYKIKALKDFGSVKKGDLGGWVQKEENLCHRSNCWIFENAEVLDDASVEGNGLVYEEARVADEARVFGNTHVSGEAQVYGNAQVWGDACISNQAEVYGNAQVFGNAKVSGSAIVFGNAQVCCDAELRSNAELCGDYFYMSGIFVGGIDGEDKVTNITKKTDSNLLDNQYVLGDYEIEPIENQEKVEDKEITVNGKRYKLIED